MGGPSSRRESGGLKEAELREWWGGKGKLGREVESLCFWALQSTFKRFFTQTPWKFSRERMLRFCLVTTFNTYSHPVRKEWVMSSMRCRGFGEPNALRGSQSCEVTGLDLHTRWSNLKSSLWTTTPQSPLLEALWAWPGHWAHLLHGSQWVDLTSGNSVPEGFDVWAQTQFHASP